VNLDIVKGIAEVYKIIMEDELKIPIEENDQVFETRLYLFYGNQKSIENTRLV
jgi:hypothetical protein